MKPHRLEACVILLVLIQIDKGRAISSCGQLQVTLAPRLTNSYETHRWPWHVAIYHRFEGTNAKYKCGGTLISSALILTAAHCVMVAPQHILVSLGRFTLDASEFSAPLIEIAEVIRHPKYEWENLENDIAIITLSTSAIFNNYVQPVCLWEANKTGLSEVVGKSGTVIGWGRTETGEVSNSLRQASLPVIGPFTCLRSNRDLYGRVLSETNFCAGIRNGTSICSGDSGGSMTFEENGVYHIRGIVSVSASKVIHETQQIVCDPMQYAVFTDVAQHLPWIHNTVTTLECSTEVRCDLSAAKTCLLVLTLARSSHRCKIIFDEISNPLVELLVIHEGEMDGIPDLSDAMEKFTNLESLHLENLKIKFVQKVRLTTFRKIRFLSLFSNEIAQMDADTFNDLGNLTYLGLDSNRLKNLPTDLFKELSHLETLRLDHNKLEMLPASLLQRNRDIRRLHLDANHLTELDANIFKELGSLQYLYLNRNKFKTLPAAVFRNNKKMRDLSLSQNQLTALDANIFEELGNLQILLLRANKLQTLPAAIFRNNKKLQKLSLAQNKLTELDANILIELVDLESLWLYENELLTLPAEIFKELGNLQILLLHENKLQTLPAAIFRNNKKLQKLSLAQNQLTELDANILIELVDLESLWLYENELLTLPAEIFKELGNLQCLHLHRNKLQTLPAAIFRNNKEMQELSLSQNQLTALDANIFKELGNLEKLWLGGNKLEVLPAGLFDDNLKLKEIYLDLNKLKEIETNFYHLTQSAKLDFRGNVCINDECGFMKDCDILTLYIHLS